MSVCIISIGDELLRGTSQDTNSSWLAGRLLELMERLNAERGVTFLFSTHDPLVIERARRTLRLTDGRIVADERKSAP